MPAEQISLAVLTECCHQHHCTEAVCLLTRSDHLLVHSGLTTKHSHTGVMNTLTKSRPYLVISLATSFDIRLISKKQHERPAWNLLQVHFPACTHPGQSFSKMPELFGLVRH